MTGGVRLSDDASSVTKAALRAVSGVSSQSQRESIDSAGSRGERNRRSPLEPISIRFTGSPFSLQISMSSAVAFPPAVARRRDDAPNLF